jgi:uncharacterized protein (DUF342 family)
MSDTTDTTVIHKSARILINGQLINNPGTKSVQIHVQMSEHIKNHISQLESTIEKYKEPLNNISLKVDMLNRFIDKENASHGHRHRSHRSNHKKSKIPETPEQTHDRIIHKIQKKLNHCIQPIVSIEELLKTRSNLRPINST